jgi:hypothetical protein
MNFKSFCLWFSLAAGLFAFIFFSERFASHPPSGPVRILPALRPSAVTSVQVRPEGQLEIRAERTNDGWVLSEPLRYPANRDAITGLLATLAKLTPAASISRREINERPNADEEYGFASPQATIIIRQGGYRLQLFIGARTAPGNQVFLQVVGHEGIYIVDADLLQFIPQQPNAWRDARLFDLGNLTFNRVCITNGQKTFELSRPLSHGPWQIITPGARTRADNAKIESLVTNLENVQVVQFITDAAKPDLESYGLQTPDLEIALARGTNTLAALNLGKSSTNLPPQYYASASGRPGVFTVSKELVEPWRTANELRDPNLIGPIGPVSSIEVKGRDEFALLATPNHGWSIKPQKFAADTNLVKDLLDSLSGMQIVQFVKSVVTEPDLPAYGLANPSLQYTITSPSTGNVFTASNLVVAFGTNQADKVFVRRTDESSVYAVSVADFNALGSASWQFRERHIWELPEKEITALTIRKNGHERRLIHKGQYEWTLAPGTEGMIEPLAVEETVRPLCHLQAAAWIAYGETNRMQYGLTNGNYQLSLETADGEKHGIEFGIPTASSFPCAAVTIEGGFWIFELPVRLSRDIAMYLISPDHP